MATQVTATRRPRSNGRRIQGPNKNWPERFHQMVDRSGTCWIWTGWKNESGYGKVWHNGSSRRSHRVAYEMAYGPVPDGMEVDHLCRNRSCVNPEHLEAVTHKENVYRGMSPNLVARRTGICARGHLIDYVRPDGTRRHCRICVEDKRAERKARAKFSSPPPCILDPTP